MGEIIRIFHGCEVRIENSIVSATVWHQDAFPSDAKLWLRGTEFSIRTIFDSFSCIPFDFEMFYFKSSIHYHIQWCWCRTFFFQMTSHVTSKWHQPIDKVKCVTSYIMKANRIHMKIFFLGWDTCKNFYPKRKPQISLSGMQEKNFYPKTLGFLIWIWYARNNFFTTKHQENTWQININ